MKVDELIRLIQNLRRGDDLEASKQAFFAEFSTPEQVREWCSALSLRWLISVVDTFIDHGTTAERPRAMVISVYFNMVKMADTVNYLRPEENLRRLANTMQLLYEDVGTVVLASDDMPNILFYRVADILHTTPHLHRIFEEIQHRLALNSPTMRAFSSYRTDFYTPAFYSGRRNFRM